nr:hybrid signal transduction histidine kinase M [Tanacetum cinerariifolium]
MTGSNATPVILLSDKLSTVTHNQLLTRVPVKLDIDNWNYASWVYFFETFCKCYEVLKYIHGSTTKVTTSTPTPLTPKELKVDSIVLSWILVTLSDTFKARKIELLATILTSLGSPVSSDDVVTYALKACPINVGDFSVINIFV